MMGVPLLMLFLLTIAGSKAASVDLCKVSITTLKFPLMASYNQNVSAQDPLYPLLCGTYTTADWFSIVCWFNVPLYDCAPTTTTSTTASTTTTSTSNCVTTPPTNATTAISSKAVVNFCKMNIATLTFPLLASYIQNETAQDPFYLLLCWTYNTADWLSFACFFNVPLYDCAPATTTTAATTTTCATNPPITCASVGGTYCTSSPALKDVCFVKKANATAAVNDWSPTACSSYGNGLGVVFDGPFGNLTSTPTAPTQDVNDWFACLGINPTLLRGIIALKEVNSTTCTLASISPALGKKVAQGPYDYGIACNLLPGSAFACVVKI